MNSDNEKNVNVPSAWSNDEDEQPSTEVVSDGAKSIKVQSPINSGRNSLTSSTEKVSTPMFQPRPGPGLGRAVKHVQPVTPSSPTTTTTTTVFKGAVQSGGNCDEDHKLEVARLTARCLDYEEHISKMRQEIVASREVNAKLSEDHRQLRDQQRRDQEERTDLSERLNAAIYKVGMLEKELNAKPPVPESDHTGKPVTNKYKTIEGRLASMGIFNTAFESWALGDVEPGELDEYQAEEFEQIAFFMSQLAELCAKVNLAGYARAYTVSQMMLNNVNSMWGTFSRANGLSRVKQPCTLLTQMFGWGNPVNDNINTAYNPMEEVKRARDEILGYRVAYNNMKDTSFREQEQRMNDKREEERRAREQKEQEDLRLRAEKQKADEKLRIEQDLLDLERKKQEYADRLTKIESGDYIPPVSAAPSTSAAQPQRYDTRYPQSKPKSKKQERPKLTRNEYVANSLREVRNNPIPPSSFDQSSRPAVIAQNQSANRLVQQMANAANTPGVTQPGSGYAQPTYPGRRQ